MVPSITQIRVSIYWWQYTEWKPVYEILAAECGIKENISQAYDELRDFFGFLSLMNV